MDIPLQHASEKILRAMNRRGSRESLTALMGKIRQRVPGVVLRTTLITGFPGETQEDFEQLAQFVKDVAFERLGCFPYSQEEGTPAAQLPGQLDEEEKERRAQLITETQLGIMERQGQELIGRRLTVLTEGFEEESGAWFGRSYMDAPDVDGRVYFTAAQPPAPGDFVEVLVEDCLDGEVFGRREP